jgi:hypothetical protein
MKLGKNVKKDNMAANIFFKDNTTHVFNFGSELLPMGKTLNDISHVDNESILYVMLLAGKEK